MTNAQIANRAYAVVLDDPAAAFAKDFPDFGQDRIWNGLTFVPRPKVDLRHHAFHIHENRRSRDCDGTYDRRSVLVPSKFTQPDDFWRAEILAAIDTGDEACTVRITPDVATIDTDTEEGFTSTELARCHMRSCDPNRRSYRDHSAEAMGY